VVKTHLGSVGVSSRIFAVYAESMGCCANNEEAQVAIAARTNRMREIVMGREYARGRGDGN
jgi:hypothetical protein